MFCGCRDHGQDAIHLNDVETQEAVNFTVIGTASAGVVQVNTAMVPDRTYSFAVDGTPDVLDGFLQPLLPSSTTFSTSRTVDAVIMPKGVAITPSGALALTQWPVLWPLRAEGTTETVNVYKLPVDGSQQVGPSRDRACAAAARL